MDSPSTNWWHSATSRFARMLGRTAPLASRSMDHTSIGSYDDENLEWLERVTADPLVRDVIREHYSRREDGQHLEFLMACSSFENARNPLQRFEQFRNIIHKFVFHGADRTVELSERTRSQLLREWSRWSDGNRLPVGLQLPALVAAAEDVRLQVASQRRL